MNLIKKSFTGIKSLIIPILLIVLQAGMLYYLNTIYGSLYDAIQNYRPKEAWQAVATFGGIAGLLVIVESYKVYELNKLIFSMRTKLLEYFESIELLNNSTKEQRLQEDSFKFTEVTVELAAAFFEAIIRIPLFVGVIMTLTSIWTGVIITSALILGTWLTKVIGSRIVESRSDYESSEAKFREDLKTKSFSASIYPLVVYNFKRYNEDLKKLTFTVGGLNQIFVLLPFIVLMPLYFSKVLTLGSFLQSARALDKIIQSLSVIIDNRNNITKYMTAKKRLEDLIK